jgi:hypothetical protein
LFSIRFFMPTNFNILYMNQFLPHLIQVSISLKRFFIIPIFLLVFFSVSGQNSFNSADGWGSGWGIGSGFSPSAGSSLIYTATNSNGSGNRYFRFYGTGSPCGQYGPSSASLQLQPDTQYNNTTITCGNDTYAYYLDVSNTTDNYVFKSASSTAAKIVIFKIQGAIRSVATVTQLPLVASVTECHKTTVTATLDGDLAIGQSVYMRYTKDGYATSTVVPLTGSGVTYTATIPSAFNTAGANVSYYVFTSGTTTPSGADADFYTINLNANEGSNYSYSVAAGGATTNIPSPIFEQELINLGLDCGIDGKVFTSNISSLTSLDIRNKNIVSLQGIEGFSGLKDLYCADNALLNLNVSMLPNLRYLDCQNNSLTNLNVTGLTNLVTLVTWNNNLSSLDLSTTTNISYLDCDDNAFASLDVSGLANLNQFYCSGNLLTSLDVRGLTNLVNFECTSNPALVDIFVDNVQAAITKSITNDPTNDPVSPYWAKETSATYTYCKSGLSTTWNGSAWSNMEPTSETAAIISGNYNESANIDACTLTINNGAIVTIPVGYNVTLNAPITVISGSSFTLSNNANLIQTNKQTVNSGNINVNRDSSPLYRFDYTMWSSPVTGTQTLGNFSPLTDTSRFYEYNSTSNLYSTVASAGTFSSAKGYLIRMPNTWGDYVVSPPSTPLSWTGTFTGTPNNGDFSYSLSNGAYVAVGNPYPSTLNVDQFISGNNGQINGTMWFWRKRNDASNLTSYSTCTTAGCALNNGHLYPNTDYISVGQGFIVKATASGNLKFTNTMRVANNTNQFFKTKAIEKNRIWLNLSKDTNPVNQMMLAYMTGATQGVDQGIDGAFINDSQTALNSLIGNEEFAIQGRSLPFDGTDVVSLAFKTSTAGTFAIALDHMDGLFSGSQDIILKDNTTGSETDLKAGPYTFVADSGVDNSRFSLKYQKTLKVVTSSFNENSVTIYKNKGTLYVNSGAVAIANIKVFDIQGRLIAEQKNVNSNTAKISNLKVAQQVLIVKVTGQNNTVVSKKVVN